MLKKIALICNIRSITDPNNPEFENQADFDDKTTIDWIKKSIEINGYEVLIIQEKFWNPEKELEEKKSEIYLAFNFTEWNFVPKILEKFNIPYTWSGSDSQYIIYNKDKTKDFFLRKNISTPDRQLVKSDKFDLKENLKFPLIVKPNCQWSSAWITNKSLVYNLSDLKSQINVILNQFPGEIIIETFLSWREFSVGMIWNPPNILPIIESDHSTLPSDFPKIDSLEVKRLFEEEDNGWDHLICPAKIERKLEERIKEICLDARDVIWIKDYCRIDVRCDEEWNPYILEINSPAWLMPPSVSMTSYLPLMARESGLTYNDLIKIIIDSAISRYNLL